jgi:hypothetical protein
MDVQQAYEKMQTTKIYFATMLARSVKIDSVTIAYWIEATDVGQDYVAPFNVFRGTCLDETGNPIWKDAFEYAI